MKNRIQKYADLFTSLIGVNKSLINIRSHGVKILVVAAKCPGSFLHVHDTSKFD